MYTYKLHWHHPDSTKKALCGAIVSFKNSTHMATDEDEVTCKACNRLITKQADDDYRKANEEDPDEEVTTQTVGKRIELMRAVCTSVVRIGLNDWTHTLTKDSNERNPAEFAIKRTKPELVPGDIYMIMAVRCKP